MKILLDECLPLTFRHSLPGHEIHTAQWAGLKGKNNGELLQAAQLQGYDVLLTVDQSIPYQQHNSYSKLSIVVLRAPTNQMEHLLPLAALILQTLESILPGDVIILPGEEFFSSPA